MSDLLASPSLVFRRRSTLETLALDAARELGAGGEARVLAVPGDDSLVAKLYHEPTLAKARKVALMMEEPPELDASAARLAWPCDLLFDGSGAFAGFLMPRAEGSRVFELYNPVTRRRTAPMADYAFLLRAAANVAAAFEALHARGYVVGDVNESNVLVGDDASVTLVDTDSMQVRDPADGVVHRSRVGKAEFTPPELQGRSFADFDRSPEHDRFGLAVLLFLLLMEGTHPFAGRLDGGGEMPPIEERIRRGLFPHDDHAEIRPPRLAPDFSILALGLRALFVRCFEDGHAAPAARPTAAEWRAALAEAEAKLVPCDVNPRHRHGRHLGACPWCTRIAILRVPDPFPADAKPPARIPAPPSADPSIAVAKPTSVPARPVAATPKQKPKSAHAPAAPVPGAHPQTASAAWLGRPPAYPHPGGDGWQKEALGREGLLHPGAWLAPAAVLVLGSEVLAMVGIAILPLLLVFTARRRLRPAPDGLPGTFAVPAAVLLVLALLLVGGRGDSWVLPPLADDGPPHETVVTRSVSLGHPFTFSGATTPPILENHAAIVLRLQERYPSSQGGKAHRLRLIARIRADGTVDPQTIQTFDSTDYDLARAVEEVARDMVFVAAEAGREITPEWIWLDVWYGAWEP